MASKFSPRVVSIAWAAYAWATAYSYVGFTPPQLSAIHSLLPGSLWLGWVLAAVLLTAGAIFPRCSLARWARVAGLAGAMGLLVLWTSAFLLDEAGPRGWVSARQYIMLGFMAYFSAGTMGRMYPRETQISQAELAEVSGLGGR